MKEYKKFNDSHSDNTSILSIKGKLSLKRLIEIEEKESSILVGKIIDRCGDYVSEVMGESAPSLITFPEKEIELYRQILKEDLVDTWSL